MKKYLLILIAVLLIPAVVIGCQSEAESVLVYQDISKVSISESSGFGKVNPDFFETYQDQEKLSIFTDLLKNASQEEGIVDMIEPQYDLKILYEDETTQGFHLWVGDDGGKSTLMNVDDTHIIYTVSPEFTNKLIDLLNE